MTTAILSVVGAIVALILLELRRVGVALLKKESSAPVPEPSGTREVIDWLVKAQKDQGHRMDRLEMAVAEGIEDRTRVQNRINKTVGGARKLLREAGLSHPGIEAEYEEIRDRDAGAREEEEVSAVPANVAPSGPTGIPGVTYEDLARMRENLDV